MVCSFPPPLTDDQLTSVLDGEADPSVLEHVARCAACSTRLAKARIVEHQLRGELCHWDCPPPQQLGDYHLGLLVQGDERSVLEHIQQCTRCSAELEDLRLFLGEGVDPQGGQNEVVPGGGGQPMGQIGARVQRRPLSTAPSGSAAGSRQAEATGTTVMLDLLPAAGLIDVMGQVVAEDQQEWSGALAELRSAGRLQAAVEVDDRGAFSYKGLAAGAVAELRIYAPSGRAVVVSDIDLHA